MNKIKLSRKTAKILDWTFWGIAVYFSFWTDWRIGIAFLAFDTMRAFEDLQESKASDSTKTKE